ncbi:hypothetical protein EDD11_010442 [Mortierella claussenii]|nr:hypothetical protein EDD11_010442 [Mortierella claussenii]
MPTRSRSPLDLEASTAITAWLLRAAVLAMCCFTTASAEAMTREQIYDQAGFVRKWVAPMPSSPLQAAGGNGINTNSSGEKFLIQNWATTFHTIQVGGNDISFVPDPFKSTTQINATDASEQVLQLDYPKGSYAPAHGPVAGGTHFYAQPFGNTTPFSKMMISYDVGFPRGFNWVSAGKLPGVYGGTPYEGCSGGIQSTGANCLTMRLMWRQNGIGEAYAYVPADPESQFCKDPSVICNDRYGKSIGRGQIHFQPGTWTRLDMVMDLNEPAGNTNGTLQVYLNGNLAIDMKDIQYRTSGMIGFQGLMFSSFFGGSDPSYATPVDTSVYFRNIQLSVGPPAKLYEGTGGNGSGGRTAGGYLDPIAAMVSALACGLSTLFLF